MHGMAEAAPQEFLHQSARLKQHVLSVPVLSSFFLPTFGAIAI